jgi:Protein of unknown function (DUF2490)
LKKIFFIVLFLSLGSAHAQSIVNHQFLYWIRYQNQLNLSSKFYTINEIDNRRFFDPNVENQFIMHSRLHYKPGRWDFGGGLTFSWIYAQKPENGYMHSVSEVRPVVEASYESPVGKSLLQHRVRIDNRFIEESQDQSVWENSFYIFRLRYRILARIPLRVNDEGTATITLRLSEEIMFNNKENTFDQNRVYASTEFYVNKSLSIETGYIFIYQQRFGMDEFYARNVVRFSLLHRMQLKRQSKS